MPHTSWTELAVTEAYFKVVKNIGWEQAIATSQIIDNVLAGSIPDPDDLQVVKETFENQVANLQWKKSNQ